jgi:hypothetical protein
MAMTDLLAAFYGLLGLDLAVILTLAVLAACGLLRATVSKPRPRKETQ